MLCDVVLGPRIQLAVELFERDVFARDNSFDIYNQANFNGNATQWLVDSVIESAADSGQWPTGVSFTTWDAAQCVVVLAFYFSARPRRDRIVSVVACMQFDDVPRAGFNFAMIGLLVMHRYARAEGQSLEDWDYAVDEINTWDSLNLSMALLDEYNSHGRQGRSVRSRHGSCALVQSWLSLFYGHTPLC